MNRRFFIRSGGVALASFGLLNVTPSFLQRAVLAQTQDRITGGRRKTLIAIFQRGAVDGLNMVVPYGAYACADGNVIFAIQTAREWRRFCAQVLEQPHLADDERFATNDRRLANREQLEDLIEGYFRPYTCARVMAMLEQADIPTAALNTVPAVAAHPQLAARARWTTVDAPGGPIPALIPPHNLQHAPARIGPVPALGQHTKEILAELDRWSTSAR